MKEAFFADMGGFVLHSTDQPPPKRSARLSPMAKRMGDALNLVHDNSVDEDPELYVPLRTMLPIYAIGGLYLLV